MQEIAFGQYAIPVILTVVLGIIYKLFVFSDKYKSLLAVSIGIALGLIAIPYNGLPWTVINVVDYMIAGLMMGASSVGLWELQKTVTSPRS